VKVLIMGLAMSGTAVARHFLGLGAEVAAIDDRPDDTGRRCAQELGILLVEAPRPSQLKEMAEQVDLVVVSPGVPASHPIFGIDALVVSELELAGSVAREKAIPLVAVTGTNGKTTVTTLVAEILRASGIKAVSAGNIGQPLIEALGTSSEVVVVEASSFQLAMTREFRPRVATWLNVSEDHLDWHPSMAHYVSAKARIWANQGSGDMAVLNLDDPVVRSHAALASQETKHSFGLWSAGADYYERDGWLWTPREERIIARSELWRSLPHDRSNALAACATALAAGGALEGCRSVLSEFSGLRHRLELVADSDGVRWYDDSKATTPASVLAALAGFDSVILIAGGRNKGLDLTPLGRATSHLRAVVTIGEAAEEIEAVFGGSGCGGLVERVTRAGSMAEAVRIARSAAHPGDVVLLSPGCSSFDWYGSYAERGNDFARFVVSQVAP
jgi:UDP-N-acetylmuramoylalanine--D-glutamate ligase